MSDAAVQHDSVRPARRASLFWKLTATFATLSLTALLLLSALFSWAYESLLTRELEGQLRAATATAENLLSKHWPQSADAELQSTVRRIGEQSGVRLTIINHDGVVLADSDQRSLSAVRGMENHRNRPEIIEAMRTGAGTALRTSPTVGDRQRYMAVRVDAEGAASRRGARFVPHAAGRCGSGWPSTLAGDHRRAYGACGHGVGRLDDQPI